MAESCATCTAFHAPLPTPSDLAAWAKSREAIAPCHQPRQATLPTLRARVKVRTNNGTNAKSEPTHDFDADPQRARYFHWPARRGDARHRRDPRPQRADRGDWRPRAGARRGGHRRIGLRHLSGSRIDAPPSVSEHPQGCARRHEPAADGLVAFGAAFLLA